MPVAAAAASDPTVRSEAIGVNPNLAVPLMKHCHFSPTQRYFPSVPLQLVCYA